MIAGGVLWPLALVWAYSTPVVAGRATAHPHGEPIPENALGRMNHDPVSYPDLYRNFAHPNQSRPGPLEPLGNDFNQFLVSYQVLLK